MVEKTDGRVMLERVARWREEWRMGDAWVVGALAGKGGGTFRHLSLMPTYSSTAYERGGG